MHKQCGSSNRTQSCCNLARNNPALAHASHHHAAAASIHQIHRALESLRHWSGNAVRQCTQRFRLNPNYIFAGMFHGNEDVTKKHKGGSRTSAIGNGGKILKRRRRGELPQRAQRKAETVFLNSQKAARTHSAPSTL